MIPRPQTPASTTPPSPTSGLVTLGRPWPSAPLPPPRHLRRRPRHPRRRHHRALRHRPPRRLAVALVSLHLTTFPRFAASAAPDYLVCDHDRRQPECVHGPLPLFATDRLQGLHRELREALPTSSTSKLKPKQHTCMNVKFLYNILYTSWQLHVTGALSVASKPSVAMQHCL